MKRLRILAIVTAIADTALNPSEDTNQASMLQTRTGAVGRNAPKIG